MPWASFRDRSDDLPSIVAGLVSAGDVVNGSRRWARGRVVARESLDKIREVVRGVWTKAANAAAARQAPEPTRSATLGPLAEMIHPVTMLPMGVVPK